MYTWIPVNSSADLTKLVASITPEYNPNEVAKRLADGISGAVKAILVEHNYIDKDYRSAYYNFYAKKGQRYNLDCVRLHFFDETISFSEENLTLNCADNQLNDHYFGYMVLRPTGIATIGRSVFSPDVRKGAGGSVITAQHKVHLLGYKLKIHGFPSMDQHIDISVCAHVACWSILRHYSERFNIHQEFNIHDITLMTQYFNPGGLVPSKGLDISHAERVFQEAGTYPVHVARKELNVDDPSFFRQLIAYVESGFPLFAATYDHAVAIIGTKWKEPKTHKDGLQYTWEQVQSLIIVDDNHLPYITIPVDADDEKDEDPYCADDIESFIVSLPEKIFYPADAVDEFAPALRNLKFISLPPENETIIRYFITTGSAYRSFVRKNASQFDPRLLKQVMSLPFAQFLWIVEFATKSEWDAGNISARAVLDATASLRDYMPVWLFHNRSQALVIDRRTVDVGTTGLNTFALEGMEDTALSRMDHNLRHIQTK